MRTDTRGRRDDGAALVIVIIWSAVLLLLAGVVSTAVLNQVRPSDRAEKSFQALAAAEAGVEDVRARLAANGTYWKQVEDFYANPLANSAVGLANPALTGWVDIPGGESSAQFTYYIDTTSASRTGRILISSTGRAGTDATEETRTVEAEVRKKTTNEYAYLSDSETYPYDAPGVYGPGQPKPDISPDKKVSMIVAEQLCGTGGASGDRYWYQWTDFPTGSGTIPQGPVSTTGVKSSTVNGWGNHRNSQLCLHGEIRDGDEWIGPIHTNDVWYIDPSITDDPFMPGGTFDGAITSSCPDAQPGSPVNGACPTEHRWISTSVVLNDGQDPSFASFKANEIPADGRNDTPWNPSYDSPVEMPSAAQLTTVKGLAASKGCLFTGPTRIRMQTVGGLGKLVITSPDTKDGSMNSFCYPGGATYFANDPKVHPTRTLDYAEMVAAGFNGVIYLQDWQEASTPPSCQPKTTPAIPGQSTYPWVIPGEAITITDGTPVGFPSAKTAWVGNLGPSKVYDEWTDHPASMCSEGHLYLQSNKDSTRGPDGGYTGQYTIASEGDIVITDDIYEASVPVTNPDNPAWGIPDPSSPNQLGLIPNRYLYIYHLQSAKGGIVGAIKDQMENLLLNFALLAPNKCIAVQDYSAVPIMSDLKIVGSIGQNNRCRLTTDASGNGYRDLFIVYDERLPLLGPPPYMAELSQEPWKVRSWSETSVRRDAMAKADVTPATGSQTKSTSASYNVLANAPTGSTLLYARILSGSGTAAVVDDEVRYTSPGAVTRTVLEFVVRKPDGTRVGQTLTISVT